MASIDKTKRLLLVSSALMMTLNLTGCNKGPANVMENPSQPQVETPSIKEGEVFYSTGYKIKSTITPQTASTLDPLIFEVYVDSNGCGKGLLGYKDTVCDVIISDNKVYVKVADNVVIQLTDIDGHIVPISLDAFSATSLESLGFAKLDGSINGFKYSTSAYIMDTSYQESDAEFERSIIAAGNTMDIPKLVSYILDTSQAGNLQGQDSGNSAGAEKASFWNNSALGVQIHDQIYSIGDYCNPTTYFEEIVPESLAPSYAYSGDTKVELKHINYQSSDGRTSFMTTDGYVQAITTSSPFKFLSFEYGMSQADVQYLLGIKLKKEQQEGWKPVLGGLIVNTKQTGASKTYVATYKDYTFTFYFDRQTKTLNGLSITNYIDFLEEGAKK